MMYILLKQLSRMPLTQVTVEKLMLRAAMLVVIKELTLDDWVYLANLVAYRTITRLHANDEQKAAMVKVLHKIDEDRRESDSSLN